MTEQSNCPMVPRLQELLDGTLTDHDQTNLAEHLEDCDECCQRIEELVGDIEGLSEGPEDSRQQCSSITLQDIVKQQLYALAPNPTTSGDSSGDSSVADDFSLDFLETSSQPDQLGRLGPYEITEVVGRGGMGVVLKGQDTRLGRCVAIKVLNPQMTSNATARKRFRRESRAAAAVSHDHVVTIHAVEEVSGLPILVMEYVQGISLQQRIKGNGPLELEEILRVGMQTASGLAAAHAQGLVHRDIKPSNILLENGVERVKITDFGLARAVDDVHLTQTGVLAGTPEYMSPEQARGEPVDHRTDLFSLGSLLYSMATGRSPFRADTSVAALRRVCEDTPRRIEEVNSEIPDWLVKVIDKLLAKDANERFQSASEVSNLLGDYLAHLQQPSVIPKPPVPEPPVGHVGSQQVTTLRRRPTWMAAIAAGLLLGVGLLFGETAGVTNVTRTVIRLVQGEGTLVIDVDDPDVEVAIDGVDLVISGGGLRQLRVPVGPYTVEARKNGKTIRTQVVTVTRGGREAVRVRYEETPRDMVARRVSKDFSDFTFSGQPSPQEEYVSFLDWESGNLGLLELATGTNRLLTNTSWPEQAWYSIFSPDGKQIAYQFYNEKFWELRIVELDGAGPRTLFGRKEIYEVKPAAWSPDGEHILAMFINGFVGEGQERQLALISVFDGSATVLPTPNDVPQPPMSFSPDGRYIAYTHQQQSDPEAYRDISILSLEEQKETLLTQHAADDFVLGWTHEGTTLVFASDRAGSFHAYTVPVSGGAAQEEPRMEEALGQFSPMGFTQLGSLYYGRLQPRNDVYTATIDFETGQVIKPPARAFKLHEGGQSAPDWSSDGKHLACRIGHSCLIRSSETGSIRELNPDLGNETASVHSLRWSPDGSSFLFAGIRKLLQVDAETGAVTEIMRGRRVFDADWSREGKAVFYVDTPDSGEPHRVVRHQLDSGAVEELCRIAERVFWLTVSPDGQRLALLTGYEDERAVKLVPATGGEPEELIKVEGITWGGVAWASDGRHLLYARRDQRSTELWRVGVEGGLPQKLGLKWSGDLLHLRVHPDGKQIAFKLNTTKSELWVMENFLKSLTVHQ